MSRPSSSSSLLPISRNESVTRLMSRESSGYSPFGTRTRNIQYDDSGLYLSSLVVTLLVAAIATIGILLLTLVISLSVMLGSCRGQPVAFSTTLPFKPLGNCDGFIMNAEVNNLQGWTVSKDCVPVVRNYMTEGQYFADFSVAIGAAAEFLESFQSKGDGSEVVVMDIDETVLSNLPYYALHNFGGDSYDENVWNEWVYQEASLPLIDSLALYKQLKSRNIGVFLLTGRPEEQRNATSANLISAGYEGWTELLLRDHGEVGLTAVEYKSSRRLQIEQQGYHILTSLGDQWSDLLGPSAGSRTFKLPNPMYYIF